MVISLVRLIRITGSLLVINDYLVVGVSLRSGRGGELFALLEL